MIKQTSLIFRLNDLEVYLVSIIGTHPPLVEPNDPNPKVRQEIWWCDPKNPKGHGPFETVFGAMKHYENYKKGVSLAATAPLDANVIQADFTPGKKGRKK